MPRTSTSPPPRRRAALPAVLSGALLAAALLGACGPAGEDGPDRPRPNVLLVSIDTLRADHLACYGYGRPTSPTLDALAAGGALFEDVTSTTSWTLPAHMSLLTGLSISAHGVCDDRLWLREGATVPARGTFVSEVLRAAGWRTAGFHTWKYVDARFGFGPGFETYERVGHSVWSHPELSERIEALRAAGDGDAIRAWRDAEPALFDEQRPTSGEAVDRALVWLREQHARQRSGDEAPFFLFLHLFDVHDDYVPPPPFDALFDPDYAGPIDGRRVTSPDSPVRGDMDPRDLEHLIALYDGEIAWVDSQVGRLLGWLDEAGLADDTLVVVTSDHGEEFYEHGQKTHRHSLQRESVHVPLILRWPGAIPAGVRVAAPAGLVDVAPTLYSLLDLPAPAGLSGADLTPALRGEAPAEPRTYLTELLLFDAGPAPERHLGLRRGAEQTLRVVPPGGTALLTRHDLGVDPTGAGPGATLAPESAAAAAFAERLAAVRERTAGERARSLPREQVLVPLSASELEELSRMGYAGADRDAAWEESPDGVRLCLDGCVWPDR